MAGYSRKATKKPAKGGVKNALFVHADGEKLPGELNGLATELSILFPWGSLLKSVVMPEVGFLEGLRRICQPQATIRIVLGYNRRCEPGVAAALELPQLEQTYLCQMVLPVCKQAGFVMNVRRMERFELKTLPTTWAHRLAYGKDREFFELCGKILAPK